MSTSIENLTALPKVHKKTVLFFWASWHDSSKAGSQMDIVFQSLASSSPSISFYKVEAEAVPELSQKYNVNVVPTFVLLEENNQALFRKVEGADPAQLTQAVSALLQINSTTANTATDSKETRLNDRIKALLNSNQVMLFMKGSPTSPKCGFSREIVTILQQEANIVDFGSFDILTDDEIRQGLKSYADWPTYPQLYVNGELVGGLDIIKEMVADCSTPNEVAASLGLDPTISLDQRLYNLTHQSKVMLFMKGAPGTPKCGFSRQIVDLFTNTHKIKFETFDILQDEEVRQGLKTYSDWPTYPQLYINGELIGGLDIVMEMSESGDLVGMLEDETMKVDA